MRTLFGMETLTKMTPTAGDRDLMTRPFPEPAPVASPLDVRCLQVECRAWWLDLAEQYLSFAEFDSAYLADAHRALDNARALRQVAA